MKCLNSLVFEQLHIKQGTYEDHPQDEKACFSRVYKTHPGDYNISFKDGQRSQRLRQELFRSINMLEGIFQSTESIRKNCKELPEHSSLQSPE